MLLLYFVLVCFIGFGSCAPNVTPGISDIKPRQIPTVKASHLWVGTGRFASPFQLVVVGRTTDVVPGLRKQLTDVLEFMKRYGYIQMDTGDSEALYTEGGISGIIKVMQRFGGIEETGVFDEDTQKLMTLPRCGVPDVIKSSRQKRYVLGPSGWEKRNISYFLANWSPRLGEQVVQKYIQKALDQWGGYGRLNFYRKNSQDADIIVEFARGYHGDNFPFDGPGSILAHAFFPHEQDQLGGDIHFDADEKWIDNSNKENHEEGTDFYFVALHELGHSLGLAHSPVRSSIMFPYYQSPDANGSPQLGYDDILAMYDMYIRKPLKEDSIVTPNGNSGYSTTTITEPTTTDGFTKWFTTEKEETVKTSTRVDESTRDTEDNPTYKEHSKESSTEGSTVSYTVEYSTVTYEGDDETVEEHKNHDTTHNMPKNSAPSFPDICDGHVDAIASLREELFVFSESYVWRFRDRGILVEGYPVKLRDMFSTLPESVTKIDAAYQRPDGNILLFTGSKFWIYNGETFSSRSPEPLTHLGIPEYVTKLDAVQNWRRNKKTYFYAMDRFWRYNETSKEMDPGYPQHMQRWRGVPSYLDAATTWKDGFTYFFRGGLFWKFDNDWIMVTDESPMPTPTYWFGCPEKNNVIMSWFLRDP